MKAFRRKLIFILHDSELNKISGSPIYDQSKGQENGSDSDITELSSLEKKTPARCSQRKQPASHLHPIHQTT
jgi:hypothetical protein